MAEQRTLEPPARLARPMLWLEVIGWVGSGIVILSLAQAQVLRFRVLNLIGGSLATFYNVWLQIWPFAAMNAIIVGINVYWLRRLLAERDDELVYQVVEVAPDDAYLRHVLRVRLADIRSFLPTFDPAVLDAVHEPEDRAFLVVHGDETVGVVAVRDAGSGVGHVLVDYVTPRFRDFTPGRFVYRTGGELAAHGFRRVVAPAGWVGADDYRAALGFHRSGDDWVLDLPAHAG